jgi:hypothetical protein
MTHMQVATGEVARAGGLTAYLLLAAAVAMGLVRSLPWQSPRWLRLLTSEIHNVLTLVALVFTGIDVLAVIVDPYTRFGLSDTFHLLASHYRPRWMAFGIIGLYLGLAIGLSSWLRPRIGSVLWQRLHTLTLVIFALLTVFGIATSAPPGEYP